MDSANRARAREPRAVLWDMDGTILDSAEYHWLAWKDTMEAEGQPITHEQFLATFGQRNDIVLRGYFGDDFPPSEIKRIADYKEARYRELVVQGGVGFLPGVRHWLETLASRGWRQAVASSAPMANIEAVIKALGAGRFFDAMVSGEDVEHGKPHPQVFLLAAERLGVIPGCCVVVEDAPAGVEAARRAGMAVIGVRTSRASLTGDVTVATLADLPPDAFEALLADQAGGTSCPS